MSISPPLLPIERWTALQSALIHTALALGNSTHDAEDLASETWLALARVGKLPDDDIPLPMAKAFVCQKLRWIAFSKHRRGKPPPENIDEMLTPPASPYPTPDKLVDLRAAVRVAIAGGGLDLFANRGDDGVTRARRHHQRQTLRAQLPA